MSSPSPQRLRSRFSVDERQILQGASANGLRAEAQRVGRGEGQVDRAPAGLRLELTPVAAVGHGRVGQEAGGAVGGPERGEAVEADPVGHKAVRNLRAVVKRFSHHTLLETQDAQPDGGVHELHLHLVAFRRANALVHVRFPDAQPQFQLGLQLAGVDHVHLTLPAIVLQPALDHPGTVLLVDRAERQAQPGFRQARPLGQTAAKERILHHVDGTAASAGRDGQGVVHLVQPRVPTLEPGVEVVLAGEGLLAGADGLTVPGEQGAGATQPGLDVGVKPLTLNPVDQHLAVHGAEQATLGLSGLLIVPQVLVERQPLQGQLIQNPGTHGLVSIARRRLEKVRLNRFQKPKTPSLSRRGWFDFKYVLKINTNRSRKRGACDVFY